MMERFLIENNGNSLRIGLNVTDYKSVDALQISIACCLEAVGDKIEKINIPDMEGDPITRKFFMACLISKICQAAILAGDLTPDNLRDIVETTTCGLPYDDFMDRFREVASRSIQQYNDLLSKIKRHGDV